MNKEEFYDRLKRAIDASLKFHGSTEKAAAAGGRSQHYLDMVLAEKTEPGFFFVAQLARELGISMNYLAGVTNEPFDISTLMPGDNMDPAALGFFDQISGKLRQAALKRGSEPTFHDVLELWHQHEKKLEAFETIIEWFDIYEVPDAKADGIQLVRMGSNSLAARTLESANLSTLQYALDHVDDDLKSGLLNAYRDAASGKPILTEEVLNVRAPGSNQKIELKYFRLLLRVVCKDGKATILSYSQAFR
ncbi:hypothetical protein KO498_08815 [Lentibacter algarum]|uniref:hypothetical protein n=1 Tax=Lentibacter algarum TaxID=576131 RepID=UPI001C066EC6|nr:hypothetical protein [Lentibacter algarum]MBU2981916.1 hypothetical protein [Lentibacter algarum]